MAAATSSKLSGLIFIGTCGKIRALEFLESGTSKVWDNELKGTGYHMVHLYLANATGLLYAVSNGHVFCFEALTGKLVWTAKPSKQNGLFAGNMMTLWCDGTVLLSAMNDYLIAFDAVIGKTLWECDMKMKAGKMGAYTIAQFKEIILVGNDGYVIAVHKATGEELWKNGMKGTGYHPISLATYTYAQHGSYTSDTLFVGNNGYVYALDPLTGKTRHETNLEGTGYYPVALLVDAATDSLYTATSSDIRCYRAEAMKLVWKHTLPFNGFSCGHSLLFSGNNLIVGAEGRAIALDKTSGTVAWTADLPGCGYVFVTVGSMANPDVILCASNGKLYSVNGADGKVLWTNDLSGMLYSDITISTAGSNIDFNSTTLPQAKEMFRDQNTKRNLHP